MAGAAPVGVEVTRQLCIHGLAERLDALRRPERRDVVDIGALHRARERLAAAPEHGGVVTPWPFELGQEGLGGCSLRHGNTPLRRRRDLGDPRLPGAAPAATHLGICALTQ